MLPLLLLLVLPSAYSQSISYVLDDVQYTRKTVLTDDYNNAPVLLSLNPKKDQLYFNIVNTVNQKSGKLYQLRGDEVYEYNRPYHCAAYDVKNNEFYFGATDGVRVGNDWRSRIIGLENESISYLFKPLAHKLLAITMPNYTVYELDLSTFVASRPALIPNAYMIVADATGNMFYYNDEGLYVLLKDLNQPIKFVGLDPKSVRALTVDYYNRVLVAATGGLYCLRTNSLIPQKLMNLDFTPYGIALTKNVIYISGEGAIYKFTPSSDFWSMFSK